MERAGTLLQPHGHDLEMSELRSASEGSSSSQTARLTPEEDSDDSDLDLNRNGSLDAIELQQRDIEKMDVGYIEEGDRTHGARGRRQGSVSTVHSFQLYTPDEERSVIRKFDRRLVLFVAALYMLSFLDRSNIGNARIAGLQDDLNLSSTQYAWILTAFYIAYISFEWMSLLWKIIPAHIFIFAIVLSWGVTASLQACTTSFTTLIFLRFFLGIGEAGFTGIPYYLSFFFKREELALRTGFFISAAPLATSFASTLAWLIIKLGQHIPIASWRLLFLVEGFPSIIVAFIAFRLIPDGPNKASYLTKREKKVARLRLRKSKVSGAADVTKSKLKWTEVFQTLTDIKCWLTALMFFTTNMAFASMPVFLPTIIREMGHSVLTSQALSAPPYLLSFIVVILTAWISDRMHSRSTFIIVHALLSASGYLMLALAEPLALGNWWRYAAVYPAAIGFFSVITIIITWTINNQESESKQGAGFAMLQIIGQCGPLVGTRLYPDQDAPYFVKGMSFCCAAMITTAVLALVLKFILVRENRKKEREHARIDLDDGADEGLVASDREKHEVTFKYML